jgi:hypothetical protein
MTKHGEELGADLGHLWLCGTTDMPEIANGFLAANSAIASVSGSKEAFARPPASATSSGSAYGIYPAWGSLAGLLQSITGQSASNMYDVGEALVRVANAYAESDAAARDKFNLDKSDYRNIYYSGDGIKGEFIGPEEASHRQNPTMPG